VRLFLWVMWLPVLAGAVDRRPLNFVFLFADDMRSDAIGAFGHPVIRTPNLDRLAREGTVFHRAVTAYPICHVSRSEIFSGRSAFRSGYHYRGRDYAPDIKLWPEAMRDAGYQTWYVGKWHSPRDPWKCGYVETRGLYSAGGGGAAAKAPTHDYKGRLVTGYRGWTFKRDDRTAEPERGVGLTPDISARFADAAMELIDRKPAQPFFLHVNFTAPHDPLLRPPGYEHAYDPARLPVPGNFRPEHPFDHGNLGGRDEVIVPQPRTESDVREELAVYYAVISHLDAQVGRIVRRLKESGQWERTVVIFSSDHGLAMGSHGLMGKQNQYEHSIGVPLIFAGGGMPEGMKVNAQCYLRDLYPTVCDLAGIPVPASVESVSLAPLFRGTDREVHPFIVGYFTNSQRMIRDGDWKLIWYPHQALYQLFDLRRDPLETDNRFNAADQAGRVFTLRNRLENWLRQAGDPLFDSR
jgi:arylsulfatase A-like enzyme